MSIFWRFIGSLAALASLIVTLPASFWFTVVILSVALSSQDRRNPPQWVDTFGLLVMIAVVIGTVWAVYRIWKPYFKDVA